MSAKGLQMPSIDALDRRIVEVLQRDGRASNVEVARQVGLSHSACSRRIARLERDGVIRGYRALTDRFALGMSVRAFCGVVREPDVGWEDLAQRLGIARHRKP